MSKTSSPYQATQIRHSEIKKAEDTLLQEESLLININSKPFTLTMRSPSCEKDLVRGILFTENIITTETPFQMEIVEKKNSIITSVNVVLNPEILPSGIFDKRNLLSVSSCGVCGKIENQMQQDTYKPIENKASVSNLQLFSMFKIMSKHQQLFKQTGGCHASAAFTSDGNLLSVMEDIGRHNAVDKVIGNLIRENKLHQADVLLVSGRVSYEIVTKTYMAKIPIIAAVSAVSSLAYDLADEMGICLIGFCRENSMTVYTNPQRVKYE